MKTKLNLGVLFILFASSALYGCSRHEKIKEPAASMSHSEIEQLARSLFSKRAPDYELRADMTVSITEKPDTWVVSFVPPITARGGGPIVTISKETGEIVDLKYTQ